MAPLPSGSTSSLNLRTVDSLIQEGLSLPGPPLFTERKLAKGENQKKIAFLSFSSGTTGKPKVRFCSRFSPPTLVAHLV